MSLKRREILAWLLLLLAALAFSFGITLISGSLSRATQELEGESGTEAPVYSSTAAAATGEESVSASVTEAWPWQTGESLSVSLEATELYTGETGSAQWATRNEQIDALAERYHSYGLLLCGLGVLAAAATVFALRQKAPLLGPDGYSVLSVVLSLLAFRRGIDSNSFWSMLLLSLVSLGALRELWGWLRARFSLEWCACARLSRPRPVLLRYSLWLALPLLLAGFTLFGGSGEDKALLTVLRLLRLLGAFGLDLICLIRYYRDALGHFQAQLERFRSDEDVELRKGPFEKTEEKLRSIQLQRREALARAVADERFRVDLISNVSHDLRTPLTAILGYGELLEKQPMTEEGKTQLSKLNQKASYMRELVDSLFELTKVSSGVLKPKHEPIDLIRLLEQTVGFFDDQLTATGLTVKRQYAIQAAPLSSDGTMLHQVFSNLLGNAIKYALQGTRIYLELTEAEGSYLVRMVNTASYEMDFTAEEIVQRFARGDKARSTQGSGLGLAIAQTYAEALGGKFEIVIDGDQFNANVTLPKN